MDDLQTLTDGIEPSTPALSFFRIVSEVLYTLQSDLSKRQYLSTYRSWLVYCQANDLHPVDGLHQATIYQYLLECATAQGGAVTFSTRRNKFAHLKKLVTVLHRQNRALWDDVLFQLQGMKVPLTDAGEQERPKNSLSPQEMVKIFAVWRDNTPVHIRNLCLLTLSFATGMRISEVTVLRWQEIDLIHRVIRVKKGKGNKSREVAIIDGLNALDHLLRLRDILGEDRVYLFPAINKSAVIGADRPMKNISVQKIIEKTRLLSGVYFSHHYGRRTMATESLASGASMADVMAQGGWQRADTVINHYAKPADARKRQKRLRPDWNIPD